MLNFLVETKQEYTIQLINILTPLVYEGLQSIYLEVVKISTNDNILKNFQSFMQRIPKWNNDIIYKETQRIMNNSKSYSWLEDLIKATLKANIVVLTYNPTVKQQIKVDPLLYQNIKINDFIHKIYIECARELWNNPYLFYHHYPPIELKRNQRDSIILIKDCIKEAIRKLLPVKHILQIYLGEEMETGIPDNNFEKSISEVEGRNLNKLIQKDLYQYNNTNNIYANDNKTSEKKNNIIDMSYYNNTNNNIEVSSKNQKNFIEDTNTVGSKILNIINNKDIRLTENMTSENDLIDIKIKNTLNELNNSESYNKNFKNIEQSETSISHNPNIKFQEIFSNNENKNKSLNNNNENKNKSLNNENKTKFFNNYLKI